MAIGNNEREQCGAERDAPPSYQTLLRQEANSNTQNLSTTQNRNYKKCILCQCCHQEKTRHSLQSTKSLERLADILETNLHSSESQIAVLMTFGMFVTSVYLLYLWITAPSHYSIEEQYQRLFVNANISEKTLANPNRRSKKTNG